MFVGSSGLWAGTVAADAVRIGALDRCGVEPPLTNIWRGCGRLQHRGLFVPQGVGYNESKGLFAYKY